VNWTEARVFRDAQPDRKIILAGGLTVQNVGAAVEATHPAAVDVASGVETATSSRRKDPGLLRAFIDAARDASRSLR
jgi:phosphoribosylanthranilate isomerase